MRGRLLGVSVIGLSLILSALVFGIFFYRSRLPEKTIRVVGAATKRIDSDIIKWRITLARNTGTTELKGGYALLQRDVENFLALLQRNGIKREDVSIQPVNLNPVYSQYEKSGNPAGYSITQGLYLASRDLAKIEKLALNPGLFTEQGAILQSSNLEYYCTNLSEIKRQLLAAATSDAQKRAAEIAKSSGDRLSKIESARVGVFQITEPYSTEVSDYGIYNTSTRQKDATVTVNVTFRLR